MALKKSDRDYGPGHRNDQEWQVFNRIKRWLDETSKGTDSLIEFFFYWDIDITFGDIINEGDIITIINEWPDDITTLTFGKGTPNYVTKWITSHILGDSITYDTGSRWGVGTEGPTDILMIEGVSNHKFGLERGMHPETEGSDFIVTAGGCTDNMINIATVVDRGRGYIAGDELYPTSWLGGFGATLTVVSITTPYGVRAVTIANGGTGYTDGDYNYYISGGGNGDAIINVTVSGGIITTINSIIAIGSGYSISSNVDISRADETGSGAKVNITDINGAVASFSITYRGSKYQTGIHTTTTNSDKGGSCTINVIDVYNTIDGDGGDLILRPGTSTGTGIGRILFRTFEPGVSGRDDNAELQRAIIDEFGYWGLNVSDPLSWSDIDGSIGNSIEITTQTSLELDITHFTVLGDATSSSIVIWLPDASTCARRRHRVKCIGLGTGYTMFVKSKGGDIDNIAAATGIEYTREEQVWGYQSDGTKWYKFGYAEDEPIDAFKYIHLVHVPEVYSITPTWADYDIVADSYKDTLNIEAGYGMIIEFDAVNDAIKFSVQDVEFDGFRIIDIDTEEEYNWNDKQVVADKEGDTLTLISGTGIEILADAEKDAIIINATFENATSEEDISFIFRDVVLGSTNIYHLDNDVSWEYDIIGYSFQVDAGSLGNVYVRRERSGASYDVVGPLTVTTALNEQDGLVSEVLVNDIITLEFDGSGSDAGEIRGKIRIKKK